MIRFENVTYTYPFASEPAVKNISLHVKAGEIVLVSGQSGCGKSTLMRLANGLCPAWFKGKIQGQILIDGKNTLHLSLKEMSLLAGTLFQDPEQQFFALGVEDELAFVHEWRGKNPKETQNIIHKFSQSFGIRHLLGQSIHELSEGQKQKLGLASIMSQEPKVLILDEPTANLDPEATLDLALRLQKLKEQGLAILVVDHRLYWLSGIADRVMLMQNGEIVGQGSFDILKNQSLRENCCLRSPSVRDVRTSLPDIPQTGGQKLSAENLTFAYKGQNPLFSNVSVCLPQGITALIGDNGTGKTTLARLMTGLNKAREGMFFLDGKPAKQKDLLRSVGIVLQNADHQLHMKTVEQELAVCIELADKKDKIKRPKNEIENQIKELLTLFGLEELRQRHPQSLSGGEKQRLVIACAFAKKPKVLILDEPTSGLDGTNMKRIARALGILSEQGTAVLVITHDLELMELSCTRALRLPIKQQ